MSAIEKLDLQQTLKNAVEAFNGENYGRAAEYCEQMVSSGVGSFDIYFILIKSYYKLGNRNLVKQYVEKIHGIKGANPTLVCDIGNVCAELRLSNMAEPIFKSILNKYPDHIGAYLGLARLYFLYDNFAQAAEYYKKVINIEPENEPALSNYAASLFRLNDIQSAERHVTKSLVINPNSFHPNFLLGSILQAKGDFVGAKDMYLKSLNIEKNSSAYCALASIKKFTKDDEELINEIKNHLEVDRLIQSQSNIHFALGKIYRDLEDYDKSFFHYDRANKIKRPIVEVNMQLEIHLAKNVKNVFTKEFFINKKGYGVDSTDPIFIVGMPRSGTSLVEQILSSHSQVKSAGELLYIELLGNAAGKKFAIDEIYPFVVDRISNKQLQNIANIYLENIAKDISYESRFVDKMPNNFFHVGFIHLLFPNAKIIHCERNPLDSCLSIYFQNFQSQKSYFFSLDELAEFYNLYKDLMDYWQSLPLASNIYNLKYEELIVNPEGKIREMLNFCNLEFEPACLEPEKNTSEVFTASSSQVRQPIYQSSTGNWQKYEKYLSGFISKVVR